MVQPTLHGNTSLAVLPFANLSANVEFDYFAVGLVEELIIDLSHFSWLRIISSYTSSQLPGAETELEAARKLDIDYLLKGCLLLSSPTIRLNIQLLDAESGGIIWAEKFEFAADNIFTVQESIIERVVYAISAEVELNTLACARQKPRTSLEAFDCLLRGMERLRRGTLQADEEAREFFTQAVAIDPHYSRAYAGMSLSYFNEWSCQLWELYESSEQNAYKYAVKAFELDDSDHIVHMILGRIYIYRRQFDQAEHHLEKSLELNSNDADSLIQLTNCFAFIGRPAKGEQLFLKALRLNPYRNLWYYQYGSFIYFVQRKYQTSIEMAHKRQLTNIWVDLPGYIAAAYAHLGKKEQAREYIELFRDSFIKSITKGRQPTLRETLDWINLANPFKHKEDTANIVDGMLKAGLEKSLAGAFHEAPPYPSSRGGDSPSIFLQEKDVWRMEYDTCEIIMPDLKGYHDIQAMLGSPEKEFHCTELMGSTSSMDENDVTFDNRAHRAYKERIEDLRQEIEETDHLNDLGRKEKLQEELDKLIDHLSKNLAINKQARKLNPPSERARAAVTLRIRSSIKKITALHPSLGKHLGNSVRTGVFCRYSPEEPREWIVN